MDKHAKTKLALEDTQQQLADKEKRLYELTESLAKATKTIKLQRSLLDNYEHGQNLEMTSSPAAALYTQLTGNVVNVSKKWDFVVIDLGRNSSFQRTLKGREGPCREGSPAE